MTTMPVEEGFYVTSPFGPRAGGFHAGTDFGRNGGSAGYPVYAIRSGTVIKAGAASGYGGPDPAGWIVIDHPTEAGGGVSEYGHIIREVSVGQQVREGQRIGRINPNSATNGGTAPHLHLSFMPYAYNPSAKQDVMPILRGAPWPNKGPAPSSPAPAPHPAQGTLFGIDISEHQDGLHLSKAKAEGIEFVILRLCDGTYVDRSFRSHLADADANGLLISTYWYVRNPSEGTSFKQQVDVIMRQLNGRKLPVWLDIETHAKLSGAQVWEAKREVESRGLHVPGVYTYVPYWESMPGGEPKMQGLGHLWVAAYGRNDFGSPRSLYAGNGASQWNYPLGDQKPIIWQYGSNAGVAGFRSVDINAFRGSRAELEKVFYGGTISHPEEDDMSAEDSRKIDRIHRELTQLYPSRSKYRVDDRPVDTLAGMLLNAEARIHEEFIERQAAARGVEPEQVADELRQIVLKNRGNR